MRRRNGATTGWPYPPQELKVFEFERWTEPGDVPPRTERTAEDKYTWRLARAASRWSQARDLWEAENLDGAPLTVRNRRMSPVDSGSGQPDPRLLP